jgi:hypothetical protein
MPSARGQRIVIMTLRTMINQMSQGRSLWGSRRVRGRRIVILDFLKKIRDQRIKDHRLASVCRNPRVWNSKLPKAQEIRAILRVGQVGQRIPEGRHIPATEKPL